MNSDRPNGKKWSRKKWPDGKPPQQVIDIAAKHSRNAAFSKPKAQIHRKFMIDAWSER